MKRPEKASNGVVTKVTILEKLLGSVMMEPANMPAEVAAKDIMKMMKYMVKNC